MQHLFFQKLTLFWHFPMATLLVCWGLHPGPHPRRNLAWQGQKHRKKPKPKRPRECLSLPNSAAHLTLTFSCTSIYRLSQSALGFLSASYLQIHGNPVVQSDSHPVRIKRALQQANTHQSHLKPQMRLLFLLLELAQHTAYIKNFEKCLQLKRNWLNILN